MTATATQMEVNKDEITTVGYKTKASENLPYRVVYLGSMVNRVKDKGKILHRYTTEKPVLKNEDWRESDKVLEKMNVEGQFVRAGFGMADFPKSNREYTLDEGMDELGLFYKNKEALGITCRDIHGVERSLSSEPIDKGQSDNSCFLDVDTGIQRIEWKRMSRTLYPVWTLEQPII